MAICHHGLEALMPERIVQLSNGNTVRIGWCCPHCGLLILDIGRG